MAWTVESTHQRSAEILREAASYWRRERIFQLAQAVRPSSLSQAKTWALPEDTMKGKGATLTPPSPCVLDTCDTEAERRYCLVSSLFFSVA